MRNSAALHRALRLDPRGETYPFLTFSSTEFQDLLNLLGDTYTKPDTLNTINQLLRRNKSKHHATCLKIKAVKTLYDYLDAESKKPDNTHRQNQLKTLKQKLQIASSLDPVTLQREELFEHVIKQLIIDGNFSVLTLLTLLTASTNSEEYSYAQLAHDFGWLDLSIAIALIDDTSDYCIPDPYARDRLDRICVMVFLIAGQARGPILTRMLTSIRSHESDLRHHLLFTTMHLAGADNDVDLCCQIITTANDDLNDDEKAFLVTQYDQYLNSHASIKPLAYWAVIHNWPCNENNPLAPYLKNQTAINKTAQMLLRWHPSAWLTRKFLLEQHPLNNITSTTCYSAIDSMVEDIIKRKDAIASIDRDLEALSVWRNSIRERINRRKKDAIVLIKHDIETFAHSFHTVDTTSQFILLRHLWSTKCFMPLAALKPDPSLMAYLHLLIGPEQQSPAEADPGEGVEESKHNNNHPSSSIDVRTHQRLAILCQRIIYGSGKLSQQEKQVLSGPLNQAQVKRIEQCLRQVVFHKLYAVPSGTTEGSFKNIPDDVLPLILAPLNQADKQCFAYTSRYGYQALLNLEHIKYIEEFGHLNAKQTQKQRARHAAIDVQHKGSCVKMSLLNSFYIITCLSFLKTNCDYRLDLDPNDDFPWTRYGVPIASALAMGICCLLVRRYHTSLNKQEYIDHIIHRNAAVDARVSGPESICSFIGRHGRSVHKRKYFILCYEVIACLALINVVTSLSLHNDSYTKEFSGGYTKNGPGFAIIESITLGIPLLYLATWGMISFFTPSERVLRADRALNEARQALDTYGSTAPASPYAAKPQPQANERSGLTEPLLVIVRP
jgi:hypothetical protein